jgi:hypothetical protein
MGKTPYAETAEGRRKEAGKDHAMSDGSFPIPDLKHLRSAIHLFRTGHGKNRKGVLALIKRRARELGVPNLAQGLSLSELENYLTIELARGAHKSTIHPGLDRKPGVSNWVDQEGGLPDYIERIAKHIHSDSGLSISHSIAAAVERVKVLAAKGNAQAIAALAQWNAKRAGARAKPNKGSKKKSVGLANTGTREKKAASFRAGQSGVRSTVAGRHYATQTRGANRVGSNRQFQEDKIVRDQGGKFGNKISNAQYTTARRIVEAAILKLQIGGSVKFPGGIGWVQRTAGGFLVQGEGGQRVAVRNASEAIEAAANMLAPRVQRLVKI